MTFYQNIISTLIGSISGFLFSIFLFYITKWIDSRLKETQLRKNLVKEIEYNTRFLDEKIDSMNKAIMKVTVDDVESVPILVYDGFQSLFVNQYMQNGHLYSKLSVDHIKFLDSFLRELSFGPGYINNQINLWKQKTLEKKDVISSLEWMKEKFVGYKSTLDLIKLKLK